MGDHHESSHCHNAHNEADPDVLGCGLMNLIGHKAANGAADHLQTILVDNSVHANCGGRQHIDLVEEGDEVSQAAINAIHNKAVERNRPDINALQCLHHTGESGLCLVDFLAVLADALFIVRNKDQAQHTGHHSDHGQENESAAQSRGALAHSPEYGQSRRSHDHVNNTASHFQEAEHSALRLFVTQKTNGLQQNGPVGHLAQNGKDAKGQQEAIIAGERCDVKSDNADSDQRTADHILLTNNITDVNTCNQADGLNDAIYAQGRADLSVRQSHEFLHGNIEHILHAGELKRNTTRKSEDAKY